MPRLVPTALACLAVCLSVPASAQVFDTRHGKVRVVPVATGLSHPWGMTFLPDGRMLVTERPGRLRIVSKNGKVGAPIAGVPRVYARGQGGLLDVTLHPDFARNRRVYFTYAEPGEGGAGAAAAYGVLSADGTRLTNVKVIFRQTPKSYGGRHFGSRIVFAPDGSVYITVGDRGDGDGDRADQARVQNFSINRGQVVRVDAEGGIPKDNPHRGSSTHRPEIWSVGHRNPQGAAIHPSTGKLWTVEHGPAGGDEVNIPLGGRNYGWPVIGIGRHYDGRPIGVGTHKEGMEQPVHNWNPQIAPSGMAFYTGDKFPAWRGNLLVAALMTNMLVRLELDGEKVVREEQMLRGLRARLRQVRTGPDGYIYLLTDNGDDRILRLEPVGTWKQ